MKFILSALLFLLVQIILFSQENPGTNTKKNILDAIYFQDYVNFGPAKPGLSKVDVFIQVPYKNVQFVKSNEGFTAKYSSYSFNF